MKDLRNLTDELPVASENPTIAEMDALAAKFFEIIEAPHIDMNEFWAAHSADMGNDVAAWVCGFLEIYEDLEDDYASND